MKKQEKTELIQSAIDTPQLCRCYFTYDDNYYYYYPNAVNDKFLLGQTEDDFLLDGYCIRKISQLKKVEIKNDKCHEINELLGITGQIAHPGIDISSWESIFSALSQFDGYIQIEDELGDQFAIGIIEKVCKNKLYFKAFDADGIWEDWEIPYSQITSVHWGTRYAQGWKCFFAQQS